MEAEAAGLLLESTSIFRWFDACIGLACCIRNICTVALNHLSAAGNFKLDIIMLSSHLHVNMAAGCLQMASVAAEADIRSKRVSPGSSTVDCWLQHTSLHLKAAQFLNTNSGSN